MTVQRMCELGTVSRAGLYRFEPEGEPPDEDLDLPDDPARCPGVSVLWPATDYSGTQAARLAGEPQAGGPHHAGDNLLCLRRRGLVVTTDSNHNLRVIPIWPRRWKSPVSTSWEAIFSSGRSRFRLKATMDVCISPHGQTLDISRAVIFPGALAPKKSEFMMARLTDGVFRMDAASATIMKKINTGALQYAPAISDNGLELYFTRASQKTRARTRRELHCVSWWRRGV